MATNKERKCPDCAGAMGPIRLIDKAQGGTHAELEYGLSETSRSFWMARFAIEGQIRAYMCQQCARILLYGEPNRA